MNACSDALQLSTYTTSLFQTYQITRIGCVTQAFQPQLQLTSKPTVIMSIVTTHATINLHNLPHD